MRRQSFGTQWPTSLQADNSYSTKDTVESRILARGIRNGDSIYLKDGVAVEQENVAPAAAKGGDANAGDARDLLELLC